MWSFLQSLILKAATSRQARGAVFILNTSTEQNYEIRTIQPLALHKLACYVQC